MSDPFKRLAWCGMVTTCALLLTSVASAQPSREIEIPFGARAAHSSIEIHPMLTTVVYLADRPISAITSHEDDYTVMKVNEDDPDDHRVLIEARVPDPRPASIAIHTTGVQIVLLIRSTDKLEKATTQVLFHKANHTPLPTLPPLSIDLWGHFGLAIGSDAAAADSSDETSMVGISGRLEVPKTQNFSLEGTATVAYVSTIELEAALFKEREGLLRRNQLLTRVTGGFSYSFPGAPLASSLRGGIGLQSRQLGPANLNLDSGAIVEGPGRRWVWDVVLTGGSEVWWPVGEASKIGLGVVMSTSALSQATGLTTFEAIISFAR